MSNALNACGLAVDVQLAVFHSLRGLVDPADCPDIEDLINDFVDRVETRVDAASLQLVKAN